MAGVGGPSETAYGWAYGVHPHRLVSFSLDGKVDLPSSPPPVVPVPVAAGHFEVEARLARQGEREFSGVCSSCHGAGSVSSGIAPDLRALGTVLSATGFENMVRNGQRVDQGMPACPDIQLTALRHDIR